MTRKQMKVNTGGSRVVGKKDDKKTAKKVAKKTGTTKPKGKDNVS